jgi:hypothetical protein
MSEDQLNQSEREDEKPRDDDKPDASAYTEGTAPQPFSTVGATEDDQADRTDEVTPGFTDMEPGAGPDYGPSGEPGRLAKEDPNQPTQEGFTQPEVAGETLDRPSDDETWSSDETPAQS